MLTVFKQTAKTLAEAFVAFARQTENEFGIGRYFFFGIYGGKVGIMLESKILSADVFKSLSIERLISKGYALVNAAVIENFADFKNGIVAVFCIAGLEYLRISVFVFLCKNIVCNFNITLINAEVCVGTVAR